jgi:chromate transporter
MTDPGRTSPPTLLRLFLVFARISLTSFGGGLSGWLLREIVTERGWITEEEFLNGLALSQALPGVNVANMSIWIGYRLFGVAGVFVALGGIILPGAVVIILLATGFEKVARFPITAALLTGAGAAAIGLSLSMGIATARRVPRRLGSLAVMAATFAGVAFFHWPVVWTVLGLGAVSIALSYRTLSARPR